MRRAFPTALAAVVLLLAGCDADQATDFAPGPGPAKIDVDTPELRTMKQDAGIEDCAPGKAGTADGGLPAVTLPCFGGGPDVDLSSLRGPMVVNLWAAWCGPCRKEMPILQSFHEEYGDSVAVLGIDYGDPQSVAAMELATKSGVTYPLLADPQSQLDRAAPFPGLVGLPFLALVDGDGRVVHQEFVALKSQQQLVDLVNDNLGTNL
jgi:thiol-disulfide isomerase/thioredoxin